jgi:hypothetical protein
VDQVGRGIILKYIKYSQAAIAKEQLKNQSAIQQKTRKNVKLSITRLMVGSIFISAASCLL